MAIDIIIYSNGNSSSTSIQVDFATEVLASSNGASFSAEQKHFFKITSGQRDLNSNPFEVRIVENESQLSLNETHWANWDAANVAGVAVTDPYPNIKTMVYDYVYDWVNGRTANQNGSSVTARPRMKFN